MSKASSGVAPSRPSVKRPHFTGCETSQNRQETSLAGEGLLAAKVTNANMFKHRIDRYHRREGYTYMTGLSICTAEIGFPEDFSALGVFYIAQVNGFLFHLLCG